MILLAIVLCLILGLNVRYFILISIIFLLVVLFIILKKKNYILLVLSVLGFGVGVGVSYINIDNNLSTYDGVVIEAKENYFLFSSHFEKLYIYEKENKYEVGDFLSISGKKSTLSFVTLESSFDFKDYLNKKGVNYQLNVDKIKINFSNPLRIKATQQSFLNNFSGDTKSLISSILFSIKDDNEIYQSVNDIHLARLLSTSGVYLNVFISLLSKVIALKLKKKWANLIAVGFLSTYFIFTFPKFAVLRIFLLFVMRWINDYLFKKKYSYPTLLAFSSLIFIVFDFHVVYSDAFILGYLLPLFSYLLNGSFSRFKGIKKKTFSLVMIYLFLLPFELKYYNEISLISLPLSIIFSPIFVLLGISGLLCFYHVPITFVCDGLTNAIKFGLGINKYFSLNIYMPPFGDVILIIYYLIFFAFLYYFQIRFKPIYRGFSIIFTSFLLIYALPINNFISDQVSFINVGQGDCCMIRKGNKTFLIDTGGLTYKDVAKECLIPYFKKQKIYNIDTIFITHHDHDHDGALESLKSNFKIGRVIDSGTDFPISYQNLTFTNYNIFVNGDDENEKSLVIGFKMHNTNFLVTGDAPMSIEKKIIDTYPNIPCDVLKVGHHGSDTSSSDAFIKYLSPIDGIISVGKNNYYGHPHKTVLNILEKYHVNIKRTDVMGTVSYVF